MEYRKLIKFGESSHVVSLPSSWIKKNKLKKGDLIYLEENGNNELVLLPNEARQNREEPKEVTINADKKNIALIKRELVSGYLKGYSKITLHGKNLDKHMKEIRKLTGCLMALEIIEENSDRIVFKDFLNYDDVDFKDIVKKMDIIIRVMFDDIKIGAKSNAENFHYRQLDVDKLYFLCLRMVETAAKKPYLLKHSKSSTNDLFTIRRIAATIETISDQLYYVAVELNKTKMDKKEEDLVKNLFEKIKKTYPEVMKAYYKNDLTLAYNLSAVKQEVFDDVEDIIEKTNNSRIAIVAEKFKNISRSIHRINRRVYN
jgi:phosphate uptake regulator